MVATSTNGPFIAGPRSTRKPVSLPELSVQTRSIRVEEIVVAFRNPGASGRTPPGVGVWVGGALVGVGVGVEVGGAGAVGVGEGVAVGGTSVGVRVGVAVGPGSVGVAVAVGVAVGAATVGVRVGVAVGDTIGVAVGGIGVGVAVGFAGVVADATFELPDSPTELTARMR